MRPPPDSNLLGLTPLPRSPNTPRRSNLLALFALLLGNLILGGLVVYLVATRPNPAQAPAPAVPSPDFSKLEENLGNFTTTLQRFNTSLVQYDFLQQEIDRLSRLAQALALRINAVEGSRTDKNGAQVDQQLQQLRELSNQVEEESRRRRATLMALISALERELAPKLDETAIQRVLQSDPPAPANGSAGDSPRPPAGAGITWDPLPRPSGQPGSASPSGAREPATPPAKSPPAPAKPATKKATDKK